MASALKKLLREQPTLDDVTKAMEELKTDGPRGTVVLAGTLLDDILRGALLYRMVSLKIEEHDVLFSGIAPLSSFSAKIKIAHAFGIIGPNVRSDLERIRELRNAFAHARMIIGFDTPEVIAEIENFKVASSIKEKPDIRGLFIGIVRLLVVHLVYKIHPDLPLSDEIKNLG